MSTLMSIIKGHVVDMQSFLTNAMRNLDNILTNLITYTTSLVPPTSNYSSDININEQFPETPKEFTEEMPSISETYTPIFPEQPEIDISSIYSAPDVDLNVSLDDLNLGEIPSFTIQSPIINTDIPSPSAIDETIPAPPELQSVDIPQEPNFNIDPIPDFNNIVIPEPYNINDITFSQINNPLQLQNLPTLNWQEYLYEGVHLNNLLEKLHDEIQNGGTGLSPDIEQAIWDRGKERDDIAYEDSVNKLMDVWASRNMELPSGILAGMIIDLNKEYFSKRSDLSRDISIEQAKLELENKKFNIDKLIAINTLLFQHNSQLMDRALKAQISSIEFAKDNLMLQIEAYNSNINMLRTSIDLYKTNLNKEQLKADSYKYLLEKSNMDISFKKLLLERHSIQQRYVEMLANVYRTRMEASRLQAEIQRLKIDLYKSQIEAYTSKLNTKLAEYDIYKAKLSAEGLKAQIYSEQVKSYSIRVESFNQVIQAKIAELDAKLKQATIKAKQAELDLQKWSEQVKAQLDTNKLKIMSYETAVKSEAIKSEAVSTNIKNIIEIYNSKLNNYSVLIETYSKQIDASIKKQQITLEKSKLNFQQYIENLKANMESFIKLADINITSIKSSASFYASLAASAMQIMNATAHVSSADNLNYSTVHEYMHAIE